MVEPSKVTPSRRLAALRVRRRLRRTLNDHRRLVDQVMSDILWYDSLSDYYDKFFATLSFYTIFIDVLVISYHFYNIKRISIS